MILIIFNSSTYSIWLISFKSSVMTFIFVILKRSHMSVSFLSPLPNQSNSPQRHQSTFFWYFFLQKSLFHNNDMLCGFLWLVSLTFSQLLRIFIHSFLRAHNKWLLLHASKVVCLDCFYFLSSKIILLSE